MPIERTGKQTEAAITRTEKTTSVFKRGEKLSTKFGGGKFGVGKFSRKKILREKM